MRRTWHGGTVLAWGAIIWFVLLVIGYYLTHKPITPEIALNLILCVWRTSAAASIFSICGGLGRRLVPDTLLHPLAELALQAGLGAGLVALGGLAVGILGGFSLWVAVLALLLLGYILRGDIKKWWQSWKLLANLWAGGTVFGRAVAILACTILGATFLSALAPPIMFDALVYHLVLPWHYLHAGRFIYVPEIMFWGMPQTAEILNTWAMALGGSSTALILGWMAGAAALAGVLGLLSQHISENAAWAGVAALLAGLTISSSLSWGYAEWWTILFGLGWLTVISLWKRTAESSQLGLAGVFAGMALGTKYTAGILLICGIAVILLDHNVTFQKRLNLLAWFVLPALLVFSPWLVKNFLITGSPVYPLIFPAGAMSALRIALYQGGKPWGSWLDIPFLPVRLTIYGVYGAPGYSASIGPLLIGLSLGAFLRWQTRADAERLLTRLALTVSLVGFLVWMIAGRFSSYLLQARLYLAFFPSLAALAAAGYAGLARIQKNGIRFWVIVETLVILVLGLTVAELTIQVIQQEAVQYALGFRSEEDFLGDNLGWYAPAMVALSSMPEENRVLMLFEARSYHCLPVCVPDEIIDRWLRERRDGVEKSRPTAVIREQLPAEGFTHLLVHKLGAEFIRKNDSNYNADDWFALEALLAGLEIEQDFGGTYQLYKLKP